MPASLVAVLVLLVGFVSVLACSGSQQLWAGIGASATEGGVPLSVQFFDQSRGKAASWEWSFGDNTTSSEQNPWHTYENVGNYTVSLTVAQANVSSTRTRTAYIDVYHIATLETTMGTIKFRLYDVEAPITTANFISLANSGFYNGLIFHRVVDGLVIQTGDPTGTGVGGSGQTIPLEINDKLTHTDGAVGMARGSDKNSATSQFYICDGAQSAFDGNYAVFGQVIEGMDVVHAISAVSVDANAKPLKDVRMTKVYVQ
ncbi:MAG: peptidylprolyl isomerase [Chloroflexi bacterium]|nr:peptidylprolyl isomerase [Chloroflexota bacterium]